MQRGKTILLADDDVAILGMFENVFADRGYEVYVATTVETAKALAEEYEPDIAIVDLRLGRDWGIDLIAHLKRANHHVHIVLLSGFVSVATAVDALHAGAADVVSKPISPRELVKRIEKGAPKIDRRDEKPPTLARASYEHMSRILADANGNVSEAARRLGVHRNTLQRMLRKVPKE